MTPSTAAADVDEWSAVVGERDIGVGLNGFAEHAAEGADDTNRDICFGQFETFGRLNRPLAGMYFTTGAMVGQEGRRCRLP